MKLKEIQSGEIFTIDNTLTYPKLRTRKGYVDMRDEIVKEVEDLQWDLQIMTNGLVAQSLEMEVEEVKKWKEELLEKYN